MILAASTSAVDKQIQLSPVISNQPLQCYVIFFFYNKYCKFFSLPISGSKLLSCRELLLYLLSLDLKWTKKVHRNFIWLYQTKRYEAQKFFHDMAKMHKNIFWFSWNLIFLWLRENIYDWCGYSLYSIRSAAIDTFNIIRMVIASKNPTQGMVFVHFKFLEMINQYYYINT